MPSPKTGTELLEQYYLDMRCHLLEFAAAMDRIQDAGGTADPRLERLRQAATMAAGPDRDRVRRFLEAMSTE